MPGFIEVAENTGVTVPDSFMGVALKGFPYRWVTRWLCCARVHCTRKL
jgi:hypothetical protein